MQIQHLSHIQLIFFIIWLLVKTSPEMGSLPWLKLSLNQNMPGWKPCPFEADTSYKQTPLL